MANLVNVDIGSLLSGAGDLAKDIREAITGKDPQAESKLIELQSTLQTAQTEINKVEASNPSLFVSGWRPFIGWICGVGLSIQFLYIPLFNPQSKYDFSELINLVIALLGLGALRTYEKVSGASK